MGSYAPTFRLRSTRMETGVPVKSEAGSGTAPCDSVARRNSAGVKIRGMTVIPIFPSHYNRSHWRLSEDNRIVSKSASIYSLYPRINDATLDFWEVPQTMSSIASSVLCLFGGGHGVGSEVASSANAEIVYDGKEIQATIG